MGKRKKCKKKILKTERVKYDMRVRERPTVTFTNDFVLKNDLVKKFLFLCISTIGLTNNLSQGIKLTASTTNQVVRYRPHTASLLRRTVLPSSDSCSVIKFNRISITNQIWVKIVDGVKSKFLSRID